MDEEGWTAVRMKLGGLLPACKAAEGMDERGQKQLEAAVARAVVTAQEPTVIRLKFAIWIPLAARCPRHRGSRATAGLAACLSG